MRFLLFLSIFSLFLYAAPAFQQTKVFTQSNGEQFKAKVQGDEYLHYIQSEDGSILIYNKKTKNYDYAVVKNGSLAPSGAPYSKQSVNGVFLLKKEPNISAKELQKLYQQRVKRFKNLQ